MADMMPLPGTASWGNPTGVGAGANPNFTNETMKQLQNLAGQQNGVAAQFGNPGPVPVAAPAPVVSGATVAPPLPTATAPLPVPASGQGGTQQTIYNPNPSGKPWLNPKAPQGGNPVVPGQQGQFGYTGTQVDLSNLKPGVNLDPRLYKELEKQYGKGAGATIWNALQQGGGFNPKVAQAFMNDIQPYFQENMMQLLEMFGASGQRFASTAALGAGKMSADFTSHQQALMAQMYQWAYQNYTNLLTGTVGQMQNQDTGFWGKIGGILGIAKTGAEVAGMFGI